MVDLEDRFTGNYITSEALKENAELCKPLEIEEIFFDEVGKEEKVIIAFKGIEKSLVLNQTNFLKIKESLGSESDDWIGAKLTLKVEKAMFQNRKVDSVRISEVTGV